MSWGVAATFGVVKATIIANVSTTTLVSIHFIANIQNCSSPMSKTQHCKLWGTQSSKEKQTRNNGIAANLNLMEKDDCILNSQSQNW